MHQPHNSRLIDAQAILCGSVDRPGLIHVVDRTAETVEKLVQSNLNMERLLAEFIAETRSSMSGLSEQVKAQSARIGTLESDKVGVISSLSKAGAWVIVLSAFAVVIFWAYVQLHPALPIKPS